MSLLDAVIQAVFVIFTPANLLLLFAATLLGMMFGAFPGLGGVTALALVIPLTFGMDPVVAFMILAGLKGGTNFGGSVTAILINTPGSGPNAATLLDGYPMTTQGRAGEAIGASAAASAGGALLGILGLVLIIPIMIPILRLFGPPEIFLLSVWGLTIISVVVKGSLLTGLISALFGVVIALHGTSAITMTDRWTYDLLVMRDGFDLIPPLIGLFAVAEMINLLAKDKNLGGDSEEISGSVWKGIKSVFQNKRVFGQSSFIGVGIGFIPGVGGTVANFVSYFATVQSSSDSDKFGKGDVRGVIASEASNDAKDGGMFLPTLAFGIPGSAAMAVLLGAFVLHGINPGPRLFEENMLIVAVIIVSLVISNVITSMVGISMSKYLIHITKMDIKILAPFILMIAFYGSFAVDNQFVNIVVTSMFGLVGYLMIREGISRVPFILALVLVPLVEDNFFRSLQISQGEYTIFIGSWVGIILISLIVLSIASPIVKTRIARNISP